MAYRNSIAGMHLLLSASGVGAQTDHSIFEVASAEQHKEARYVVVVDKGGPRLEKSSLTDKDCPPAETAGQIPCHRFNRGRGRGLHACGATMDDLVGAVENWTDRPLLNKTGIAGLWKIKTQPFLPIEVSSTPPAPGTKGEAGIELADLPTIFQVFEELGLKMKADKDKVDTYVIESIQRPTEN